MNQKVLVVEDNRVTAAMIKRKLERELAVTVHIIANLAEVKAHLEDYSSAQSEPYLIAILDLSLPDAPNGEVVDFVASKDIPSVVLTGTFDETVRNELFSKNIIDYLIKDGNQDLILITQAVRRLQRNVESKVLIVDDSRFTRHYLAKLLHRQHFQVLQAADGIEALKVVANEPNIKLVITDFNMPNMDGYELIGQLRKQYGPEAMAIIGVSASDDNYLTARFLKLGANDFIKKPFGVEEFYCRVTQNLELINLIQEIKDASNTDYLTKLYNRRYFFEYAPRIYDRCRHEKKPIAIAMLDIDFFKKINDTYGHDGGDYALQHLAVFLKESFRPEDIVSRFGGEEFCILMLNTTAEGAAEKLEKIRVQIEEQVLQFHEKKIKFTISCGVNANFGDNLNHMIKVADERLYRAKEEGRNRVIKN